MLKVIQSKLHTLFVPLLFWLSGIIIATHFSYHWSINFLLVICFPVMIFIPKMRIYLFLFLLFLLGWMYTTYYLQPTNNEIGYYLTPDMPITEKFTYKVLEIKHTNADKQYYIINLTKLNDYSITGKVLLYNSSDSLKLYSIYQTPLTISSIEKPLNPAEFDFHKYYKYKGIEGKASAIGLTEYIGKDETFWQGFKSGVVTKIDSTFKQNKPLALALFLGQKGILKTNQEQLSNLGLLHLFAVSGLHVGIIYFWINTLLIFLLRSYYKRVYSIIPLIIYGFLCAWTPSVFRTVLIITIYNLMFTFQRKISFLQLISLTLFIITITNPLQLFSVGLHLSLTAFISLWLADRKLLPYFYKLKRKYNLNKYLFRVIQYLIYSLSVVIFIAPLSAYYFNVISFNSLVTNIVATPIVTLMLNIILLSLFIPQCFVAQEYLSQAFAFLNAIFFKIIDYASFLPLFTRRFALTGYELLAIILIILITIIIFKKRKISALFFVVSASIILVLILKGILVNYQNQVICFATGKADCNYLEFAEGQNLLIDTGSQEQPPNIIKTSVLPYLRKRHIHNLDRVIITHPHEDHYGGLPLLAKNVNIKELIIHQTALHDQTFTKLIKELESELNITVLQDTTSLWGGKVKLLHPNVDYESTNMNNNSIVVLISYDNEKLLFTGDIEEEVEQQLVKLYGKELKADFLKVPHHGSITSSTEEFLEMVSPDRCFIPAGTSERDKFPNPIILQRLKDRNIEVNIGADDGALIMKIKP